MWHLLVQAACEHAPGEGLDGDRSLANGQIRAPDPHHPVLLLTDKSCSSETQHFCIPKRQGENTRENKTAQSHEGARRSERMWEKKKQRMREHQREGEPER